MSRHASKPMPTSLRGAFEQDKAHALARHRLNIERLAELMGTTPATLYKWLETDAMPINRLAAWAHLAASGHKVVIDIPHGSATGPQDVQGLQTTLNHAWARCWTFTPAGWIATPASPPSPAASRCSLGTAKTSVRTINPNWS